RDHAHWNQDRGLGRAVRRAPAEAPYVVQQVRHEGRSTQRRSGTINQGVTMNAPLKAVHEPQFRKEIGKIQGVRFGSGGYQDACIGVTFVLGSDKESWVVHDFGGAWATKRSSSAQWTEEDRIRRLGEMVMRLNALMQD